MKKIIKLLCFTFLMIMVCENVHAETFTCAVLGDEAQFDYQLAKIIKYVILIIQIAVPVILVVLGTMDMLKAISSQKEDDIKKGQQTFIKRLIAAVIIFFVFAIVKLVISVVAGETKDGIMNCANCFIKGPTDSSCG